MKNLFPVAFSLVLMWALTLAATETSGAPMGGEDRDLALVSDVTVKEISEGVFRVTATGIVGDPGWLVNLYPVVHVIPPETWLIHTAKTRRPGSWTQVITPWTASVDLNLSKETQQVAVKGLDKEGKVHTITKPVPW